MRSDGQSVAPAALAGSKASRRWLRHKPRDPNKEAGVESPASVLWATGRCKGTRCGTLCRGQRWCQGCVGTTGARRQPGTEGRPLLPPHPHQCDQTGHSQRRSQARPESRRDRRPSSTYHQVTTKMAAVSPLDWHPGQRCSSGSPGAGASQGRAVAHTSPAVGLPAGWTCPLPQAQARSVSLQKPHGCGSSLSFAVRPLGMLCCGCFSATFLCSQSSSCARPAGAGGSAPSAQGCVGSRAGGHPSLLAFPTASHLMLTCSSLFLTRGNNSPD